MSDNKKNIDDLFTDMQSDPNLCQDILEVFGSFKKMAEVGQYFGYDVTEQSFKDKFNQLNSQRVNTMAMGEDDCKPAPKKNTATTMMIGEEDGKPTPDKAITTMAMGEEGRGRPAPAPDKPMTTQAVGEEDSKPTPPKKITTMAVGEEGSCLKR